METSTPWDSVDRLLKASWISSRARTREPPWPPAPDGSLDLLRGIEKFDPRRGKPFGSYAVWWVRQGVRHAQATQARARATDLRRGPGQAAPRHTRAPARPVSAAAEPHGIDCARYGATLTRMSPSVRPQPLLAVRDVRASARWYATLLGAARSSEQMGSDHDHVYDRLLVAGRLVLQLHAWDAEDHPNLVDPRGGRNGHGVLVWFELDDLDAAVARARALNAQVVEDVHVNPAPGHRELWLRDPDGYLVVLCSPDGEAEAPGSR